MNIVTTPQSAHSRPIITIAEFKTKFKRSVASRDSNSFVPLRSRIVTAQFEAVLEALLNEDYTTAQEHIAILDKLGIHYHLFECQDPAREGTFAAVMERARPGSPDYRGWGAFLVRPLISCRRVYQAPHVSFDAYTADLTFQAFTEDAGSAVAMFAGTHRYANGEDPPIADVARLPENVFHALTAYLAHRGQATGTPPWFVQFHGCAERQLQPQITISNGATDPRLTRDNPLVKIKDRIQASTSLSVAACGWREHLNIDTETALLLCGKSNIQGLLLEHMGLRETFVHIEIARRSRAEYHAGTEPGSSGVLTLFATLRHVLE